MATKTKKTGKPAAADKIVLLLHGIRTQASWTEMAADVFSKGAQARVFPIKYGFLDSFRFLFPFFTRNGAVKRFIQEYRDIKLTNPDLPISVVAHSFGTYVVAKALARETDIVFDKIIFCGCIVSSRFRVAPHRAQIRTLPILNDCGTHDVWPIIAKSVTWGFGATGTFGFGTMGIRDRFNKFTHSAYFDRRFITDLWVPYLQDGTIKPTQWEIERPAPPYWQSLLSVLPLRWAMVGLLLLGLFWKDIAVYWRGSYIAFNGDTFLGHWIGVPRVFVRVTAGNASFAAKQFLLTGATLTAPSGRPTELKLERISYCFGAMTNPQTIAVNPFNYATCDFEFIGDTANIMKTSPEVEVVMAQNQVMTLQPDPKRLLIKPPLLDKLRATADREMVWETGTWTLRLAASTFNMDGSYANQTRANSTLTISGSLTITESDLRAFDSAKDAYQSGIGVFFMWRDYEPARLRQFAIEPPASN